MTSPDETTVADNVMKHRMEQSHKSNLAFESLTEWTNEQTCPSETLPTLPQEVASPASVVALDDSTLVVVGGGKDHPERVWIWHDDKTWTVGPNLPQGGRIDHCAVVCNGFIYVVGGKCANHTWVSFQRDTTIVRLSVATLLEHVSSTTTTTSSSPLSPSTKPAVTKNPSSSSSSSSSLWTILDGRLSTIRRDAAAVVVRNEVIVVLGGSVRDSYSTHILNTVDLVHVTGSHHASVTVTAGPVMPLPRQWLGAAVVGGGTHIVVVGGTSTGRMPQPDEAWNTMDCFTFDDPDNDNKTQNNTSDTTATATPSTTHRYSFWRP